MIYCILASILVVVIHELGHILGIMIFNLSEHRKFNEYTIEISSKYFYVVHKEFNQPYKNFLVAIAGSLLPIIVASTLTIFFNTQFVSIFFLFSLLNIIFLHPKLPDGQNVIKLLKEMRNPL
ncbi:hypothetical protein CDB3_29815 [Bacillus sp. CDB3]|nr:hypothetical protein CDB3_29815 [Bacillus sp. CDB3]